MPVQVKELEINKAESQPLGVHHMVRALGSATHKTETGDEVYSASAVDAQVHNWLGQGYKLKDTHYLGPVTVNGVLGASVVGYRILYIFVRE